MRKLASLTIVAVAVAAATLLQLALPAEAAEDLRQAVCKADAVPQFDMVGRYASATEALRLELFACGGGYVEWRQNDGPHGVSYYAVRHLTGGGYALLGLTPDFVTGSWLNSTDKLIVKPAEPGWIEAIPWDDYWGPVKVYRLFKQR